MAQGGELVFEDAGVEDLERYTLNSDLVIVAAGKGEIAQLFTRDAERSAYDAPQRALALTYVNGMEPRAEYSAVSFNLIPGVGEYFAFPALTTTGPCEIMVFEGIPGGPMDCWKGLTPAGTPGNVQEHPEAVPAVGSRPRRRRRTDRPERLPARPLRRPRFATPLPPCPAAGTSWALPTSWSSTIPSPARAPTTPANVRPRTCRASRNTAKASFDAAFMQATFETLLELRPARGPVDQRPSGSAAAARS